jgi:hypothetical protein
MTTVIMVFPSIQFEARLAVGSDAAGGDAAGGDAAGGSTHSPRGGGGRPGDTSPNSLTN